MDENWYGKEVLQYTCSIFVVLLYLPLFRASNRKSFFYSVQVPCLSWSVSTIFIACRVFLDLSKKWFCFAGVLIYYLLLCRKLKIIRNSNVYVNKAVNVYVNNAIDVYINKAIDWSNLFTLCTLTNRCFAKTITKVLKLM